jgi:hypothetical protein
VDDDDDLAIARHEAAHAVAACVLRLPYDPLVFRGEQSKVSCAGAVYGGSPIDDARLLRDLYVVCLVGPVIDEAMGLSRERIAVSREGHDESARELDVPEWIEYDVDALLDDAWTKARMVVEEFRAEIDALGEALLNAPDQRIEPRDVSKFLRDFPR